MIPTIPSYLDKEFEIDDNQTLIRNPNNLSQFSKYKDGDTLPPNYSIGDRKLIPLNTKVKITDVKTDADRNVFVFAVPVDAPDFIPSGWTRAGNLDGKFLNETIGFFPGSWVLEPQGDNFTVVDKKALIRSGSPDFSSTQEIIPPGTYVEITARSRETTPEGKYVRVRHLSVENGNMVGGEPIGWTAASNLVAGNSEEFKTEEWLNSKGDNAAWKSGKFLGSKLLIGIVGTGGQLQKIAIETTFPVLRLMEAAKKLNIVISIRSGFRTYAKQDRLYQGYKSGQPGFNLAAKPRRSNHQNGIAFDLNTGGFDGAPVYDWMKKNATSFGFIRTVNREHWHWEYRPQTAEEFLKEGKFKLARVTK